MIAIGRTLHTDLVRGMGFLVVGLIIALSIALMLGAVPLELRDILGRDPVTMTILLDIRLPRVCLAALVGAILAMSGATFQVLLRNPLADPFILGVSGGAACGAALITALGLARHPAVLSAAAFAGASLATFAVLTIGRRGLAHDSSGLLLAGLVLNAFFSAVILLSLSMVPGADLTVAFRWMMGSLFGARWSDVALLFIVFTLAFILLTVLASEVRMLSFGEEDARARGIDTERVKTIAFVVASLATGAAVSVSGIIGFIGLLVPHLIRMVWPHDYRLVLPLGALGGAILLVLADGFSRALIAPAELPVGALTALLGVPAFFFLMRRSA